MIVVGYHSVTYECLRINHIRHTEVGTTLEFQLPEGDDQQFPALFAFYILTPLLPIYLDAQFKADKDMIGLVLSGYVVATLLIRPFSGFIVDSFNRKKVLMLCFFAFFICFAGYIGAGTLLMFAIVRTMHGIPFGAATVATAPWP